MNIIFDPVETDTRLVIPPRCRGCLITCQHNGRTMAAWKADEELIRLSLTGLNKCNTKYRVVVKEDNSLMEIIKYAFYSKLLRGAIRSIQQDTKKGRIPGAGKKRLPAVARKSDK